jgi:hypothetical protein
VERGGDAGVFGGMDAAGDDEGGAGFVAVDEPEGEFVGGFGNRKFNCAEELFSRGCGELGDLEGGIGHEETLVENYQMSWGQAQTMSLGLAVSGFRNLDKHSYEGVYVSKKTGINLIELYGGNVPESVKAEGERLAQLIEEHCQQPYDASRARIGLAIRVEGTVGVPFKQTGIKTEPFAEGLICANIYVKRAEWDVSLTSYRRFLWFNINQAIWTCVQKLKTRKLSIDREKLRHDLSFVGNKFMGGDVGSEELARASSTVPLPEDKNSEDEEQRVVVQYRTNDRNAPCDFNQKIEFESLLNEALSYGGLGFCDCVDFDFSTVNAICPVSNAKKATKAIIDTLRANDKLDGAVIEQTVKGKRKVVWPKDFVGGIDYI